MKTLSNKLVSVSAMLGVAFSLCLGGVAGCASTHANRSTGQYIDDKAVTERVKDALENSPVYKLDEVVVTTFRGTVQLSGFVTTEKQKEQAGKVAQQVPGVKNVENNITVKPNEHEGSTSAQ